MFRKRKFVFDDEAKQIFLDELEQHGLVGKAARKIGTISRIIYAAVKEDAEFKEAYEESLLIYREKIEEEIHRRAVEGVEEAVFYRGIAMDTRTVYSDQLLQFHAKANIEKYGDRSKQDIVISGGVLVAPAPIQSTEAWLETQQAPPQNQLPPSQSAQTEDNDSEVIDVDSRPADPVPV